MRHAQLYPCRFCRIQGKQRNFETPSELEAHLKNAHKRLLRSNSLTLQEYLNGEIHA